MTAIELWNLLSSAGPRESVSIDATGIRIGRHDHIDVPVSPDLADLVYRAHWSDGLASDYLRNDL